MGLAPNSCATHEFPLATESRNKMFEPASAKIRTEMVEVKAEVCDVGIHRHSGLVRQHEAQQ
jgi:hypothetical protein